MFALVFMKTWELLFHAWDGKEGAVGVVTIAPYARVAAGPGDPYVAIICARGFFSADSNEFDEGVEGVEGVGDSVQCVGASSVEAIVDASS